MTSQIGDSEQRPGPLRAEPAGGHSGDDAAGIDVVLVTGLSGAGRGTAAKVLEDSKSDVSWGNQIRSYVLDQSRIKDLRTGVEIGNTTAVLDGGLDEFMQASLKQGL